MNEPRERQVYFSSKFCLSAICTHSNELIRYWYFWQNWARFHPSWNVKRYKRLPRMPIYLWLLQTLSSQNDCSLVTLAYMTYHVIYTKVTQLQPFPLVYFVLAFTCQKIKNLWLPSGLFPLHPLSSLFLHFISLTKSRNN